MSLLEKLKKRKRLAPLKSVDFEQDDSFYILTKRPKDEGVKDEKTKVDESKPKVEEAKPKVEETRPDKNRQGPIVVELDEAEVEIDNEIERDLDGPLRNAEEIRGEDMRLENARSTATQSSGSGECTRSVSQPVAMNDKRHSIYVDLDLDQSDSEEFGSVGPVRPVGLRPVGLRPVRPAVSVESFEFGPEFILREFRSAGLPVKARQEAAEQAQRETRPTEITRTITDTTNDEPELDARVQRLLAERRARKLAAGDDLDITIHVTSVVPGLEFEDSFTAKASDRFSKLREAIAKRYGANADARFSYRAVRVFDGTTFDALRAGSKLNVRFVTDEQLKEERYMLEREEEEEEEEEGQKEKEEEEEEEEEEETEETEENDGTFVVRLQGKQGIVEARVSAQTQLLKLLQHYRTQYSIPEHTSLLLVFDDEPLDTNAVVGSTELEDGFTVDVEED